MQRKNGLSPLADDRSRVLILGTLPGDESLRQQRYYANPGNQFWDILSGVYGEAVPTDYPERVEFLLLKGLALWDVCASADRQGSLDANIKQESPNDLEGLVTAHPLIHRILLNGGKAGRLFDKHFAESRVLQDIPALRLPSTSGMRGKHVLPLSEKVAKWGAAL